MTQSILRTALTTMALIMLFAGSHNLNRTGAQQGFEIVEGGGGGSFCQACGCGPGGPRLCCSMQWPDGTQVTCFCNDVCG